MTKRDGSGQKCFRSLLCESPGLRPGPGEGLPTPATPFLRTLHDKVSRKRSLLDTDESTSVALNRIRISRYTCMKCHTLHASRRDRHGFPIDLIRCRNTLIMNDNVGWRELDIRHNHKAALIFCCPFADNRIAPSTRRQSREHDNNGDRPERSLHRGLRIPDCSSKDIPPDALFVPSYRRFALVSAFPARGCTSSSRVLKSGTRRCALRHKA